MPLRRPTLAGLLAVAFAASVSADVVGIDYGTEFIKVALVKPGKPLVRSCSYDYAATTAPTPPRPHTTPTP